MGPKGSPWAVVGHSLDEILTTGDGRMVDRSRMDETTTQFIQDCSKTVTLDGKIRTRGTRGKVIASKFGAKLLRGDRARSDLIHGTAFR